MTVAELNQRKVEILAEIVSARASLAQVQAQLVEARAVEAEQAAKAKTRRQAERSAERERRAEQRAAQSEASAKRVEYLIDDVVELLGEFKESPAAAAERIGRTPGAISRALYRAGRPDLAHPFETEYRRTRKPPVESAGAKARRQARDREYVAARRYERQERRAA